MKRCFAALAAAALLLCCAACGAHTPEVSSVSAPEPVVEKAWRFASRVETFVDEYRAADGALLCTGDYEYPILDLVDDGGNPYSGVGAPPPEEMTAACRAFNDRFPEAGFSDSFTELKAAAETARQSGGSYGLPYTQEQNVASLYQTAWLVSVEYDFYTYTGGAHAYGGRETLNFDLAHGQAIDWTELTDDEPALRARLGGAVAAAIQRSDMGWELFDGYERDARALSYAVCGFDELGINITFPESVLGPHAAGTPRFSVEYEKFEDLLSDYGRALLGRAGPD